MALAKAETTPASAASKKYLPQVEQLLGVGEDPKEIMRALDALLVISGVPEDIRLDVNARARALMGLEEPQKAEIVKVSVSSTTEPPPEII
jgi:hypothetical protein